MQILVFFRAVMVPGLVALLLAEKSSPEQKNGGKDKGKSKGPALLNKRNRGSKGKMELCITLDPAATNVPDSSPVLPSRSVSPWTYTASYDESRIPSLIFEAKCERTGCVTKDGHENSGLESRPVYYQILVLRRKKGKKKKYSVQLEKMTISVGCTCVVPLVIPQKE